MKIRNKIIIKKIKIDIIINININIKTFFII